MDFSLVIPTYNRGPSLLEVVEHLATLDYPTEQFEVIIVDDGSTDGGVEQIDAEQVPYQLKLIRQANAGASAARNRGIEEARGRYCLFIDDDVFPVTTLLGDHMKLHEQGQRLLVRGPVINIPSLPLPSAPPPLWQHFSMNYLCTSNASLETKLLFEAGLFDCDFPRWEDAELGVRLKKIGVRRKFTLPGFVYHLKPPLEAESVLETAAKDGLSAALLYRRYPSLRMRLRSGLHPVNYLKNELATGGPLKNLYRRWLEEDRGGWKGNLARGLLAEREYLKEGRRALKDGHHRRTL